MRYSRLAGWVILFIGYLGTAGARAGGDDLEALLAEGKQFAISARGCALVDGYQCDNQIEDNFLSASSQSDMVSGNLLKSGCYLNNRPGNANKPASAVRMPGCFILIILNKRFRLFIF